MKILTIIEVIVKQIREVVGVLTTKEEITFDEIETRVWKAILEIGRLMIEGIITNFGKACLLIAFFPWRSIKPCSYLSSYLIKLSDYVAPG